MANNPAIPSPIAVPLNDITYTVTAINSVGCKAIDSVTIHINFNDGIYVPTGFTPGNGGRNDLFKPALAAQYKIEEFSVYNRWGQNLFRQKSMAKDGMAN